MTLTLKALRAAIGSGSDTEILEGCKIFEPDLNSVDEALVWVWIIIDELLERGRYRAVLVFLLGKDVFDPAPPSVNKIFDTIENNAKSIILGAGSQGKSYGTICYLFLDWLADPEFTAVRITSVTGGHAKEVAFSAIQRFWHGSILKLPGVAQTEYVGLSTKDRHASISVLPVPPGEEGRQVLRGFHPIRRPVPHPKYGVLSRIRVLLDEAIMIPATIWIGVGNVLSNLNETDTVKVIACANPTDPMSILANMSQPVKGGWAGVDIDNDTEWISKDGWAVLRLDAATSPNVVQRRLVYDGYMTIEGYMEYVLKGVDHPLYESLARGIFPRSASPDCIIPNSWLDDGFVGQFLFEPGGTSVMVAGVDLAYTGDDCIFFLGQYGKSCRWVPGGSTKVIQMTEPDGTPSKPKYVLQLEQYFTLPPKARSGERYEQIQSLVKKHGVAYEFLSLDATGAGRGTVDNFIERGYKVREISWGGSATDKKILEEDTLRANERFTDITSEMYHAAARWIEGGFVKKRHYCDPDDRLRTELTGRRCKPSARLGPPPHHEPLMGIEKKEEFKARYGSRSPDVADAFVMMLHGCRLGGGELVRIVRRPSLRLATPAYESFEKTKFIDWGHEDDTNSPHANNA
jgi:hypothetical protein